MSYHVKHPWYRTKPWTRHSLILITVGLAYIAIGIMYMLQPLSEIRTEVLKLAFNVMPYNWWCVGFMIVGVISIVSARWPSAPKSLGYSVLTGYTSAWAGFNIIGGIAAEPNNTVYVGSGVVWAILAFLWWAVSGLVVLPKERMIGECITPSGHCTSCDRCGSVCVCHTETGLESES